LKAARALVAHIKKTAKEKAAASAKKSLLDDPDDEGSGSVADTPIWLTLTTKRHIHEKDKARLKPSKIPVPHPLNADANGSICLITADPQRAYKEVVASDEFPAELRARVTRVIGYSKLRAKFDRYENQRQLLAEHDVFLGDERIINRLPKALGKTFYKGTTKRPVPVVLAPKTAKVEGKSAPRKQKKKGKDMAVEDASVGSAKDVAAEIQRAVGAAIVCLSPSTNTAVKVGYAGWPAEHLAANIERVATVLVDKFVPQKWRNVKSIYVKGPETTALPVWLTQELWLDGGDVVDEGALAVAAAKQATKKERANVGKKRKSLDAGEEGEETTDAPPPPAKKPKKPKKPTPESDDKQLLKQISETKAKLRKQKAKAKAALDD
jgi:ribosome biogenesis protein UTP30